MFISQVLGFSGGYFSFVGQINFVPYQHFLNILFGICLDAVNPILDIIKGLPVGHIESDQHALGPFVELVRYCFESLLTCSVPNFDIN